MPKLVRAGRVHPEVWRRAKFPWTAVCFHLACSGGVQWGLHKAGRARLGYFLIITTGVARVQVSHVSARVAHGAVRGVGAVRNVVFRGRAGVVRRFSFVPGRGHGAGDTPPDFGPSATWSFAIWLVAFAASFPILVIFGAAYFYSHKFERFIRRRKKPEYETLWLYFERYARRIGIL